MKTSVGAYEAKTKLPELLRGVQAGKCYTITYRGEAIAELGPAATRRSGAADAAKRMKQFMHEAPVRGVDIKALIEARRHKLSAYDAAYLELALRTGLPLATLDEQLLKAARKSGVKRFAAA